MIKIKKIYENLKKEFLLLNTPGGPAFAGKRLIQKHYKGKLKTTAMTSVFKTAILSWNAQIT